MNETNDNVKPYKASGNLNTMLSNPDSNINNAMNVNIQNTNEPVNTQNNNTNQNVVSQAPSPSVNTPSVQEEPVNNEQNNEVKKEPIVSPQNVANVSTANNVNRTFVNNEPQKQKKTVKVTYSPELKIAIFIVVLLLVFLMFIPVIENFVRSILH